MMGRDDGCSSVMIEPITPAASVSCLTCWESVPVTRSTIRSQVSVAERQGTELTSRRTLISRHPSGSQEPDERTPRSEQLSDDLDPWQFRCRTPSPKESPSESVDHQGRWQPSQDVQFAIRES